MAGLEDLMMLQQLEQRTNPLYALAQGVGRGIEEGRAQMTAQKAQEAQNAHTLKMIDKFNTTNSGKLGELQPSLKMDKNGVFNLTASTETSSSYATRIKTERENREAESLAQSVRGGVDSVELGRQFPSMAKEIKELEDLGVISPKKSIAQQGVYSVLPDGSIQRPTANVSGSGDGVVTEFTAQGRPKTVISRSGKIEEGEIKTIQKVQETQTEESVKSIRSFNRVKSAVQGIVGASKRIVKEQGGFGLVQQIKGNIKRAAAKTGLFNVKPEEAQAGQAELVGQVRETVLALSPILTNQNRVIQGIIDMVSETLPKPKAATTGTEFTAQLKQTTRNAYKLSKALNTGALSSAEISDLNNASPEEIKRQFKKILNKSSWTTQDEKDFEEEWQEIISVPATTAEDIFSSGGQSIKSKYGL